MMNREITKPPTWQWLERELVSRLRTLEGNRNSTRRPLAEFLDETLRQGVSVKKPYEKQLMGRDDD